MDLFAKAGIAAPPKTWEDFTWAARKIQALGAGTIGYPLSLGPEEALAEWAIRMWNNGGDWKSGDAWAINGKRNVQTPRFLFALIERHLVGGLTAGRVK